MFSITQQSPSCEVLANILFWGYPIWRLCFVCGVQRQAFCHLLPTHPTQGTPLLLALPKGRAPLRFLSRKHRNKIAGPSRTLWASHTLSPNGPLPWLPSTCLFVWPRSLGSIGAHGQRQSYGPVALGRSLLVCFFPVASEGSGHRDGWTHAQELSPRLVGVSET